jgi:hypothetical protein
MYYTSETSVDKYFTLQYIPEDNSERHTRRRENLKSHITKHIGSFVYARFVQSLSNTYECIGDFRFSLCCSIVYRNY